MWLLRSLSSILCALTATGCVANLSAPLPAGRAGPGDPWADHVIAADHLGQLNVSIYGDDYTCSDERAILGPGDDGFDECQLDHVLSRLATHQFADHCKRDGRARVLLFIHGGLNFLGVSVRRARDHLQKVLDDCKYPIFLTWQSDPFLGYADYVVNIRGGQRIDDDSSWRLYERAGAPFYVLGDVVEGVARAPATWANLTRNFFETLACAPWSSSQVALSPNESTYRSTYGANLSKETNVYIDGSHEVACSFGAAAQFLVTSPAKIAVAPLADSFGETTWRSLLRAAHAVIRTDADFWQTGVQRWGGRPCWSDLSYAAPEPVPDEDLIGSGLFARFALKLQRLLCSEIEDEVSSSGRASTRQRYHDVIDVEVVAHSMGAIIANEMIHNIDLDYRNIVYLAAACSIRHFGLTVVPYLENSRRRHQGNSRTARFYNVMLHPQIDANEVYALGLVPSGSLLEWIDKMYEPSNSTVDRTLGKWTNVRAAKWMFPDRVQRHMFFKIIGTGGDGPNGHARFTAVVEDPHGEVRYDYWSEQYWGHRTLNNSEEPRESDLRSVASPDRPDAIRAAAQ